MLEEYPPKSIVIAKVKGYPAWPAMVLDPDLLPSHILNKRPKNKQQEPTPNVLPIKFFSDDTYIWIKSNDIKPLSKDDIAAHFVQSSQKRRKDTVLDQAFRLASDPLDMEVFIKYGSKGAPDVIEMDEDDDNDENDEEETVVVKTPARKKQKVSTTSKLTSSKRSIAEAKREAERELLAQYDSDWGLQDINKYSIKEGNYIFDSLAEQKAVFDNIPDISQFSELYEKSIEKFKKIEEQVIEQLLSATPNTDELCHLLTQFLALISKLPRSSITKSQLLRALILDQRKHSSDQAQHEFKDKTAKILKRLGIEVRENTEDELVVKSENSTAQSTPASTAQSTPEVTEPVRKEEIVVKQESEAVNSVDSPLKHEVQINGF